MKLHEIKLLKEYAKPKQDGLKPFEIRKNDRDYQVGDLIRYSVPDDENLNKIFRRTLYQIMYITDYEQKDGYIVFCDRYLTTIETYGENNMESEKVKEIKEALELNEYYAIEYFSQSGESKIFTFTDLLTLINELESENERLILQYERIKTDSEMNCLEFKDRIAELENTIKNNLQYAKGYGDGVKATVEVAYPKKLNEFAEKLKEKAKNLKLGSVEVHNFLWETDIDETLKEFIKND